MLNLNGSFKTMKNLYKTEVYYLGDLSDKQESKLLSYLQEIEPESDWSWIFDSTKYIYFDEEWIESDVVIHPSTDSKDVINALTLFQTNKNDRIIEIQLRIQELNNEILELDDELTRLTYEEKIQNTNL